MFLAGLKFGIGFLAGTSGLMAVMIGLVALAECVKKWWNSESERARQQRAKEAEFRREMIDRAERAIARREKVLFLLRYPSAAGERLESADGRTEYIQ